MPSDLSKSWPDLCSLTRCRRQAAQTLKSILSRCRTHDRCEMPIKMNGFSDKQTDNLAVAPLHLPIMVTECDCQSFLRVDGCTHYRHGGPEQTNYMGQEGGALPSRQYLSVATRAEPRGDFFVQFWAVFSAARAGLATFRMRFGSFSGSFSAFFKPFFVSK